MKTICFVLSLLLVPIFSSTHAMVDPDEVLMGNALIDPTIIYVRRAFNTIFDTNTSFTAVASVSIEAPGGEPGLPSKQDFSCVIQNDWERYEFDAANIVPHADPERMNFYKRLGMDKLIWIQSFRKKMSYMIYPAQKAYVAGTPVTPGFEGEEAFPKIERTKVGEEIVDGHKCVKFKTKVNCFMGDLQGMRWEATDLKGFPIKSLVEMDEGIITTVFKNVKLGASPSEAFEPNKDYKRYTREEFTKHLEQIITKQNENEKK